MDCKEIVKLYKKYQAKENKNWAYANSILYRMCEEEPYHNSKHVIAGKILLIGRSYAAAIERRKNAKESNDDFYYNKVAPQILSNSKKLDSLIITLRQSKNTIEEDLSIILKTHNFLTSIFVKLTGLEKRSLASKYLHFHCPNKFFIYDSRANTTIKKLIKKSNHNIHKQSKNVDPEYGNFVCRMIELQKYLEEHTGKNLTPRELDSFLLSLNNV